MKCEHKVVTKIYHWWWNYKCEHCGKRIRSLPFGNYYYWSDKK